MNRGVFPGIGLLYRAADGSIVSLGRRSGRSRGIKFA